MAELGGKPAPATAVATGSEWTILNRKKQAVTIPALPRPQVFIACMGAEAKSEAVKLASALRRAGVGAIEATGGKSLKAQLRQANNLSVRHTVIIGEQELKTGTVVLRDMASSEQKSVPLGEVLNLLR